MTNKVAIITGGSRGIGAAITLNLAKAGYHVVFNYNRAKEAGEKIKAACEALHVKAVMVQADTGSKEDCKQMIDIAMETFGRIDVLVNNAGIEGASGPTSDVAEIEVDHIMQVNVLGVFYMVKYASKVMKEANQGGSIINISSMNGTYCVENNAAYSASKACVDALTKSWAKELAPMKITVNSIAPGITETDMVASLPEEVRQSILNAPRMGRFGSAEEIAAAVAFFTSEDARYITGQVLVIDGSTRM